MTNGFHGHKCCNWEETASRVKTDSNKRKCESYKVGVFT